MIIDKKLIMADGLTLVKDISALATATSTVLDLVKPGMYDNAWFYLRIDADVAGTSSTIKFDLMTSSDNFSSSSVVLFSTGALVEAGLTADTEIVKIRLPIGVLRYLKVVATVAVADTTTGSFDALIVPDVNESF